MEQILSVLFAFGLFAVLSGFIGLLWIKACPWDYAFHVRNYRRLAIVIPASFALAFVFSGFPTFKKEAPAFVVQSTPGVTKPEVKKTKKGKKLAVTPEVSPQLNVPAPTTPTPTVWEKMKTPAQWAFLLSLLFGAPAVVIFRSRHDRAPKNAPSERDIELLAGEEVEIKTTKLTHENKSLVEALQQKDQELEKLRPLLNSITPIIDPPKKSEPDLATPNYDFGNDIL
jgi:hypothetical protein